MQLLMVMEECAELQHACSKKIRNVNAPIYKIAEEIADVEIMCEQIKCIWTLKYDVSKTKKVKLDRLKAIIEKESVKPEDK